MDIKLRPNDIVRIPGIGGLFMVLDNLGDREIRVIQQGQTGCERPKGFTRVLTYERVQFVRRPLIFPVKETGKLLTGTKVVLTAKGLLHYFDNANNPALMVGTLDVSYGSRVHWTPEVHNCYSLGYLADADAFFEVGKLKQKTFDFFAEK